MRLVGKIWPETRFMVTHKFFKLILQVLERLFFYKRPRVALEKKPNY